MQVTNWKSASAISCHLDLAFEELPPRLGSRDATAAVTAAANDDNVTIDAADAADYLELTSNLDANCCQNRK